MADAESGTLSAYGWWAGGNGTIQATSGNDTYDAATYVYGPFRAAYEIDETGTILQGSLTHDTLGDRSPWSGIEWDSTNKNWRASSS